MTNIANTYTDTQANIRPGPQQVRARIEELLGANTGETAPPEKLAVLIESATKSTKDRLTLAKKLSRRVSIIAIKSDGSKASLTLWKTNQSRRASVDELADWYPDGSSNGMGIIGGDISENRLIIDFEDINIFYDWLKKAIDAGHRDILKQCAVVRTPRINPNPNGGIHLYLRLNFQPPGGKKLAFQKNGDTLIETKASGGYWLIPGSPAECHPNKLTYELVCGNLFNVPEIDKATFNELLNLAREFCEKQKRMPHDQVSGHDDDRQPLDFRTLTDAELMEQFPAPVDIDSLREALTRISSDSYEVWIRVAIALKWSVKKELLTNEEAFELWDKWSAKSIKYHANEMRIRWAGIKPDGRIKINTVFGLAQENEEEKFETIDFDEDWPLPEDLTDELLPVPTLPAELIPDGLSGWVEDVAYRMQVPLSFCAVGALVVAGSIIGAGCGIKPKEKDDWTVIPNLWGVIIAKPGKLKSPAMEAIIKPLGELEAEAKQLYELDLVEHQFRQKEFENRKKVLEEMLREAIKYEEGTKK